ncbi:hypothetical protein BDB00DRAFT_785509 [Zychaea mexicana]|uniref:uncharacterized protein n=1 Tax=Zychaea mexicana TaxID=64656 RepID=UPI0022FF20D5|nr:uncharacterized protein BDB00DRAFT_785509 [Zychaea mexicana]KAI9496418.1 hypothetical protein BDB00DRAFT_785509 [Zychaea mexicana]
MSSSGRRPSANTPRVRTIPFHPIPALLTLTALLCLGVGLYEYFLSDLQKYPPPVRHALRRALYYQNKKDIPLALKYFREALQLGVESPELETDGAPLTGIMIQLGTLLESLGRHPEAKQTLTLAMRHLLGLENSNAEGGGEKKPDAAMFDVDISALDPVVQKKVVGIAQKLGDIHAVMRRDEEAERWYTWSVEHLLRISSKPTSEYGDDGDKRIFDKEHMPTWLTHTELGSSLETLGRFYADRNKYTYAMPLYLQALTLAGVDSCHATVIMNNLSEGFAAMGRMEEAKNWAERGVELAQNPNTRKANKDGEVCDDTCGVLLYNLGMIHEQLDDKAGAMVFYAKAKKHGQEHKSIDVVQEADQSLKRLRADRQQ